MAKKSHFSNRTTPHRGRTTAACRISTSQAEKVSDDVSELGSEFEDMSLTDGPHPWKNETPAERGLEDTVSVSEKYKSFLKQSYILGNEVLIREIVKDLPDSIAERSDQNGTRRDLLWEAQPIRTTPNYVKSTYYIDCEYFCTIHIPKNSKKYFHINEKKVSGVQKTYRWIFVPSYCRARCGFFDWSKTEVENTFRVIVVRPSQFNEYREEVERGSNLYVAVLSLPEEGNGVGYARYWIQKIAEHFELNWVWMIDDDVKWMCELFPSAEENPGEPQKRKCSFEFVFKTIEKLAKDNNLSAVGPRVFDGQEVGSVKDPFIYEPPPGVVLLNVQKIREKGLHYRPELVMLEDMIFGYECFLARLKVCVMNRFLSCNNM